MSVILFRSQWIKSDSCIKMLSRGRWAPPLLYYESIACYAVDEQVTSTDWALRAMGFTPRFPDKMAAIFLTFSTAFSCVKMREFRLRLYWNSFLRCELFQHWFRQWLGADQATSNYLNQWWLAYWRTYALLGLNQLIQFTEIIETCIGRNGFGWLDYRHFNCVWIYLHMEFQQHLDDTKKLICWSNLKFQLKILGTTYPLPWLMACDL